MMLLHLSFFATHVAAATTTTNSPLITTAEPGSSNGPNLLHLFIGVSVTILACLFSSLGVNMQAAALVAERKKKAKESNPGSPADGSLSALELKRGPGTVAGTGVEGSLGERMVVVEDEGMDSESPPSRRSSFAGSSGGGIAGGETRLVARHHQQQLLAVDTRRRSSSAEESPRGSVEAIISTTSYGIPMTTTSTPLLSNRRSGERPTSRWEKWFRDWQWYIGFTIYLICQSTGSVIALSFIPPVILAPLDSTGLIFNLFFSRLFLGSRITRSDYLGTLLIVIGCTVVSIFASNMPDDRKTLDDLIRTYTHPSFIIYSSITLAFVIILFSVIKLLETGGVRVLLLFQIAKSRICSVLFPSFLFRNFKLPSLFWRRSSPHHNHHHHHHHHSNSGSEEAIADARSPLSSSRESISTIGDEEKAPLILYSDRPTSTSATTTTTTSSFPTQHLIQKKRKVRTFVETNADEQSTESPLLMDIEAANAAAAAVGVAVAAGRALPGDSTPGYETPGSTRSATPSTSECQKRALRNRIGMLYAVVGGTMASNTLMLAKSGIGLLLLTIFDSQNQFHGAFAFVLLGCLGFTIVSQLFALNRGLYHALPTLVVPLFYTLYTCLSLVNTLVCLHALRSNRPDESSEGDLSPLAAVVIALGIATIIGGVWLLRESSEGQVLGAEEGIHPVGGDEGHPERVSGGRSGVREQWDPYCDEPLGREGLDDGRGGRSDYGSVDFRERSDGTSTTT
ncbi:hypothetical protein HK102_005039 [Quaeritorhiza haematococci]|nr:hypothetical protein HK102_005039 [Quaeritorhiza haematococci]